MRDKNEPAIKSQTRNIQPVTYPAKKVNYHTLLGMAGTRKKKIQRKKTRKNRKGGGASPPPSNVALSNDPPPPNAPPPPKNNRNANYYNRLLKNLKERVAKKGIDRLSPNENKWIEWFRTHKNPDWPRYNFIVNDPDASYAARLPNKIETPTNQTQTNSKNGNTSHLS